ncbi:tail fiber domain-containing protein [Sinorhizobium americanum]|uniref:tail fiber domain-containing protein n=1 Tax=Sinorhizobium americanum TaxID=194963 RepID=UPI00055BB36B|nr:tail fiber domain-containing protein [Sinorhizobium americanum]
MGKSKAPTPPDPKATAAAQTATNIGTAVANGYMGNVNQMTPDGSLSYSYTTQKWTDPLSGNVYDLPVATATQNLSEMQQKIKDQNDVASLNLATLATSQSSRLNDLLGKPMDISKAPAAGDPSKLSLPQYQQFAAGPKLQTFIGNAGDITRNYETDFDTSKYENALMARLNPQLERDRAALETRLANQGLQPGSEAYNRAIDEANRTSNDARIAAVLNAGQEQTRLANLASQKASFENAAQAQAYGQALQNADFGNNANQQMYQNGQSATAANNALQDQNFNAQQAQITAQNTARANYLNEQYAQRNQPINEISALLSGAQVTSPNFVPTQGQSIQPVDYAGLVQQNYQNQVAAYNARQQAGGNLLDSLLGFLPKSDRRAKKNIEKIGRLKGHNLYEFHYKGEPASGPKHTGVMAQEVEKTRPDAVSRGPDGMRRVDYGRLFAAGKRAG